MLTRSKLIVLIGIIVLLFSVTACSRITKFQQPLQNSTSNLSTANSDDENVVKWLEPIISEYLQDDNPPLPPAPVLTQLLPSANQHISDLSSDIIATFNKAVNGASETSMVIHRNFVGKESSTTGQYSGNGTNALRFNPIRNFFPGEKVHVTLANSHINPTDGGLWAGPYIYEFRAKTLDTASQAFFKDSLQTLGASRSFDVAFGDLDADGDLDAFVANSSENFIWINNAGLFTDSGQRLGNSNSIGVKLGDLDNDGDLDAFVANNGQQNTIWLNDSTGVFTNSGQILPSIPSVDVELGDFNADGFLDAVVVNYQESTTIYMNKNGNFVNFGSSFGHLSTFDATLGDLNNDGTLDIVLSVDIDEPSEVYLNNGALGFFKSQSLSNSFSIGTQLGDLDNDGDLDVFVSNFAQPNEVWLNNNGVLTNSGQTLGSSNTISTQLGDLDGDGDLDAYTLNFNQPNRVWLNNNGSFTTNNQLLGSSASFDAALGDVDGDGDLDVFVANVSTESTSPAQSNTLWINSRPPPTLIELNPSLHEISAPADTNISALFNKAVVGANDNDFVVHRGFKGKQKAITNGTYSGDHSSALHFDPSQNFFSGEKVEVTLTNGIYPTDNGANSRAITYRFRTKVANTGATGDFVLQTPTPLLSEIGYGALGDLDNDGDLDIFGYRIENYVLLNNGNGTFAYLPQPPEIDSSSKDGVVLGDLDNDGDLDSIIISRSRGSMVYLNDGNGIFLNLPQSPILGENDDTTDVNLGDLDSDGDLDAFFVNNQGTSKVYMNNGVGLFQELVQTPLISIPYAVSDDAELGDLDNDGDLDIFLTLPYEGNKVLLNDGKGYFSENSQSLNGFSSHGVALGDLDKDGDLDALTIRIQEPGKIYVNNGKGQFTELGQLPANATDNFARDIQLGDLDGDGDLDAYTTNELINQVYVNDGNANFNLISQSNNYSNLNSSYAIQLGDLDNDGDLDVFATDIVSEGSIFLNDSP